MVTPNWLFVALALQRDEAETLVGDKIKQRSGGREQRRRLVILPVEGVHHPFHARNLDSETKPWVGGVLCQIAGSVRIPHAAHEREPRHRLEFIVEE